MGNPKFIPFKFNDRVLLKVQKKGNLNINKFDPNYSGPFRVARAFDNGNTYEIADMVTGKISRAHYMQLRPYKVPPKYLSRMLEDIVVPNLMPADQGSAQPTYEPVVAADLISSESVSSPGSSDSSSEGSEFGL